MPSEASIALVLALGVDLFLGEPPSRIHPVVGMGRVARYFERIAPKSTPGRAFASGALLAALVPTSFAAAAFFLLEVFAPIPTGRTLVAVFLLKSSFALRALGEAGATVERGLRASDLAHARESLRSLCSRDPRALEEPELVQATVESLAENASDSVVAPIFYFVLFGVPGAIFYRAVNTLDAMFGYRGAYEYFGKASARFDDLLNFLPARLTAGLLLVAGILHGARVREGFAILRRDGGRTESPNAGRPMAAMAGLLGARLEKPGAYALGDANVVLGADSIGEAFRLVRSAALLSVAIAAIAGGFLHA